MILMVMYFFYFSNKISTTCAEPINPVKPLLAFTFIRSPDVDALMIRIAAVVALDTLVDIWWNKH